MFMGLYSMFSRFLWDLVVVVTKPLYIIFEKASQAGKISSD